MAGAERSDDGTVEEKPVDVPAKALPPAPPEEDWALRFKYLLADFENYRKRSDRERDGVRRSARAEILRALIPLYEAFERGLAASDSLKPDDPLRKGLELLSKEWSAFWKAEHVEPVAHVGGEFRPEDHEAVGEARLAPGFKEGSVAEIVQQGYRSPAGLLRPAKVIVSRASPPSAAPMVAAAASDAAPDEGPEGTE